MPVSGIYLTPIRNGICWPMKLRVQGLFFSVFGSITGMVWANYTWGTPWTNDPKLNGVGVALLFYVPTFDCARERVTNKTKDA